jgi:hypothetical protein
MDLSCVSLSSQRLLLKSFTRDDAREAFLAAMATIAWFMSWESRDMDFVAMSR